MSDPASSNNIAAAWQSTASECYELANRLTQVDPLVIDYFLAQNPQLQSIGRPLIAWVILECHSKFEESRRNQNRDKPEHIEKDNWYRFVIHKLVRDCSKSANLLLNNVKFITFNYDFSLEQELYKAFSSIEMFNHEDIDEVFVDDRVIHVYGNVRNCPPVVAPINLEFQSNHAKYHGNSKLLQQDYKTFLDEIFEASKTIKAIDPHDKESNKEAINIAQNVVVDAQIVFLLGYGFDENNSSRLDLQFHLKHPKPKVILFTNFHDINQINKKVSQLIHGSSDMFMHPHGPIRGNPQQTGWYYEKSIRDVYEALELDFDSLEDQLLTASKV